MPPSTPHKARPHVDDRPINDFVCFIDETPVDEWNARITAFEDLVDSIGPGDDDNAWYTCPVTLRHLAPSIGTLLKDARSIVVKKTCVKLAQLWKTTPSRYLFKDLQSVLLQVHGQTVQVIRTAVHSMMVDCIPAVPCKMVLPVWMEAVRHHKARATRQACVEYIDLGLERWNSNNGYLTRDIVVQTSAVLVQACRDKDASVRTAARTAVRNIEGRFAEYWPIICQECTDIKLRQWMTGEADQETVSVVSRASSLSRRYRSQTTADVPVTIAVGGGGGLGPPQRLGAGTPPRRPGSSRPSSRANTPDSLLPPRPAEDNDADDQLLSSVLDGLSKNLNVTTTSHLDTIDATKPKPAKSPEFPSSLLNFRGGSVETVPLSSSSDESSPPKDLTEIKALASKDLHETTAVKPPATIAETPAKISAATTTNPTSPPDSTTYSSTSSSTAATPPQRNNTTSPRISTMSRLKDFASKRRSRNSILLKQRFSQDESENNKKKPNSPVPPEHMVLAIRLLRAHKQHVDQIMETLKLEMEALRNFDELLEQPGRPTENEVLDYFESVGLCLEQRLNVGTHLQEEMNRISNGQSSEM